MVTLPKRQLEDMSQEELETIVNAMRLKAAIQPEYDWHIKNAEEEHNITHGVAMKCFNVAFPNKFYGKLSDK